jgi:hypothetical protein
MPNEFPDESREENQISITCGGGKIDAVYSQTRFTASAGAQPGTCEITVKGAAGYTPGSEIVVSGAGGPIWTGLLMSVEHGDFFPAGDGESGSAKTVLHGVDLNIVFDKLIVYNHDDPRKLPHDDKPWEAGTKDREVIVYTLQNDCDISKFNIGTGLVKECGIACFDKGIFFSPGMTLRGFMEKVAMAVKRSTPGSVVWYIDAEKQLIYTDQELYDAPFSVGDDGVQCRDFSFTEDISNIRNDVFVWANTLDPNPVNKKVKAYFNYSRKKNDSSIGQYGRFQYGESQPHYMQGWLDGRATKILTQQGDPAKSCRFSIFKGGLKPGMLVSVNIGSHGISQKMPIRSVTVDFPSPSIARYTVTCSFDTQDPWGLLLAVRRPAQRGFTQPRYAALDPTIDKADLPPTDVYTSLDEIAEPMSDIRFKVSYAYIGNSTNVWTSGLMQACGEDYIEEDQAKGIIKFMKPQVDEDGHRLVVIVSYQAQGKKSEVE